MARNATQVAARPGGYLTRRPPVELDWKTFVEGNPFFRGMLQSATDSPGECDELVVQALNFHRDVVEALIRFRDAAKAKEDGAHLPAHSTDASPKRPEIPSRTALPSLDGDPILLTPRETEVLKLIAQGNSSKQVAYSLGISFKTAVCHRYNIMEKLNIHDVSGLVRYAIRNGLIRP